MLSKSEKKYINSLAVKKYRDKEQLFVVEGEKSVNEFIGSHFNVKTVYHTHEYNIVTNNIDTVKVTPTEMEQISNLKTPSQVLAVVQMPHVQLNNTVYNKELIIALDNVQDPGNLGTIIRLADWFGIKHIICAAYTADAYGPKTVQATMGALTRVQLLYTDLYSFLKPLKDTVPLYGTFLQGNNIYKTELTSNGIIIMGNEGRGISSEIEELVTKKIFIPPFGGGSESLNVAVATAVICSEFRRRI